MSVIFDQLDNIQSLRFNFSQAIKLGAQLYFINNHNLKRLVVGDDQITQFTEQEAINVLSGVQQICSDGKVIYCLMDSGDLYSIDSQPKQLVQGKNYMTITPTTAIDHSGRGFWWKTNKTIYSHCKHISTYKEKLTLITIGGKIFNIENDTQVPIQQLNGLGINGYFKKSLLFQFGGLALTENGDAYCYTNKMIKLKINNLEDISANNKFIFAIQGKSLLQWNLEDFSNHQFYVNQTLFKKMNYGNEITINCKRKEFQEIRFIYSDVYSQFCSAQLRMIQKINQNDQSISVLERTFCRSNVSTLKQQLFDQWDPPSKRRNQEIRQSRQGKGDKTERSDTSNKLTDRYDRKDDLSLESRFRQSTNTNILDTFFDRSNKQESREIEYNSEKKQEINQFSIETTFNYKKNSKSKSDIITPLEITKLPQFEKQQPIQEQQSIGLKKDDNQPNLEQEEIKIKPSNLLEQYKKQFDLQIQPNTEECIQQVLDKGQVAKDQDIPLQIKNVAAPSQNTINQKLQSIRETYDQPRFKTQNNSLYTLDEESSFEQSVCQDDDDKGKFQLKRQAFLINDIFDTKVEIKPNQKRIEQLKTQNIQKEVVSPVQVQENPIQLQKIVIPDMDLPPVQSKLNNLITKLQLKPEKSLDQVLESQTQKDEQESASSFIPFESQTVIPDTQQRQIKSFLKGDTIQSSKQKKTFEVMEQQSVIDYQNNSDFIDQQQDSFMQILQTEKKSDNNKIQNIMQIFDQISVQPKKMSPARLNIFKKQDQENIQKIEIIPDIEQLNSKVELNNVLTEKQNENIVEKKVDSPQKLNEKEQKAVIALLNSNSEEQVIEDRIVQVIQIVQPSEQNKIESATKENGEQLIKLLPVQMDESRILRKVNQLSEVKQPAFDNKSSITFSDQKQAVSRIKIQPINCSALRPEKNFTPLRSRRDSSARGSSIDTNRFKQLQIETQIVAPENNYQSGQINQERLDYSNAVYHIDQSILDDPTKRTPVAQVLDIINLNQFSNQKSKEPVLVRIQATSQIPQSLRSNSIEPNLKKTESSPIKQLKLQVKPQNNDKVSNIKRRQQDIILRKLFFRIDIHVKLAKLEFMFNLKQKAGK
ncbi:unnamed protein product (macronuclear) [Paramecium tetraurelia]|uniref:Uncharacterized protein n=1 Tax=Paramecium tetraurelia TaxID=5888 RepID=A0D0P8_PARTE|nr:uncharacterized protein GSPATT00012167001 [Paramecium tetraurelia]CAK76615.1 unnamed protein product [Paramecium tetraurelia]|eukprot:XP_001444012.1 hypothetical protein (macronuclear) [Paramecium tetraurelia strain d4-2]